jgi:Tol biopolymer transport system component
LTKVFHLLINTPILRASLRLCLLACLLMFIISMSALAWGDVLGGDTLAYTTLQDDERALMLLDVRLNIHTPLLRPQEGIADWRMVWSPDGEYVVFTSNRANDAIPVSRISDMHLFSVRANGRDMRLLTDAPLRAESVVWSPDGAHLAYTQNRASGQPDIYILPVQDGQAQGEAINLTDTQGIRENQVAWSSDGTEVLYAKQPSNRDFALVRQRIDERIATPITQGIGGDQLSSWSPDGEHIAFLSYRYGRFDPFIMRADGSQQRQIVLPEQVTTGVPQWSPHSDAFLVHGASGALYIVSISGEIQTYALEEVRTFYGTWSPDGRMVSFVATHSDGLRLWLLDVDTGTMHVLHQPEGGAILLPQWQPNRR